MMIIFIMALPIMYGLLMHDAVTMPKEAIAEIAHRGLCGKLAEALYPYMEFEMSDDYRTGNAIIRGRLRVVKPNYRF